MFEGLIDFIEETVFSLINQIQSRQPGDGLRQAAGIVSVVVQFAERNPGMTRVMVGDALVFEHERLQQRMNQFFDKLEAALRQCLREAMEAAGTATPTVDAQVRASLITAFLLGRLQRFARSGYRKSPSEHLDACLARML
jgi:TetR/AcrR family transcriptional regulator